VASIPLGLALNLGGVVLPHALADVLDILGCATMPCALLALGASLASLELRLWTEACAVVLAELVLLPDPPRVSNTPFARSSETQAIRSSSR
jgi:predicted permease